VPLQFNLPHGWHLSNAGYAVSPPPLDRRWCPHHRAACTHVVG
jgi:hypothetical protein